ncbi:MAG: hypothetical protein HC852_11230 [Acaryochloridaceae cyanobacterium RU_4_10]|nr:hypothetical protein [Acaryochloridaceae cyanobacterium RU_4_10]
MFWQKRKSKVYEVKPIYERRYEARLPHGFWIELFPKLEPSFFRPDCDVFLTSGFYSCYYDFPHGLVDYPEKKFIQGKRNFEITEVENSSPITDLALCIEDSARAAYRSYLELVSIKERRHKTSEMNPSEILNLDQVLAGYSEQIEMIKTNLRSFEDNVKQLYDRIVKETNFIYSDLESVKYLPIPGVNSLDLDVLQERNAKLSELIISFQKLDQEQQDD